MHASHSSSGRAGPVSDRRSVGLAATRAARLAGSFADVRIRRAIALANAYAETLVSADALEAALRQVGCAALEARARAAAPVWTIMEGRRAAGAVTEVQLAEGVAEVLGSALHAGGCFAAVTPAFLPAWLTSDAVGIAAAIVREGPRDLLPILADALEDAGCVDPIILLHCRGAEPHARECWVARRILECGRTAEAKAHE